MTTSWLRNLDRWDISWIFQGRQLQLNHSLGHLLSHIEHYVVGWHRRPVIWTSARIGSPGPGRFTYSHCGWVPLRPSDSGCGQNWKLGTGVIHLLSLWLGAIEAQWFWLQPELEARDRGDSSTLTVVGCHWGPVILWLGAIEAQWFWLRPELEARDRGDSPTLTWLGAIEAQWFWLQPELEVQDRGDSPTLTVVGCHWGPVILTSARIGSPGPGEIAQLSQWLGAIDAQWFGLWPELEARDRGDSPTITGWMALTPSDLDFGQNWKPGTGEIPLLSQVGWHWRPVIQTSARIGSPGLGSFPYSFQMIPRGILRTRITGNPTVFDKPVELHWWICGDKVIGYRILWSWSRPPRTSP
jgi:hypothetical protein